MTTDENPFQSWFNDEVDADEAKQRISWASNDEVDADEARQRISWPYKGSLRSEYFLEDLMTFVEYPTPHKRNDIIKWLEEAYLAGYARRAWESSNVR
jgi:hypothetical protein